MAKKGVASGYDCRCISQRFWQRKSVLEGTRLGSVMFTAKKREKTALSRTAISNDGMEYTNSYTLFDLREIQTVFLSPRPISGRQQDHIVDLINNNRVFISGEGAKSSAGTAKKFVALERNHSSSRHCVHPERVLRSSKKTGQELFMRSGRIGCWTMVAAKGRVGLSVVLVLRMAKDGGLEGEGKARDSRMSHRH